MSNYLPFKIDKNSFFSQCVNSTLTEWQGYTTHPFLKQLAQGTLPKKSFQTYLMQDYLYLIQFARVWSLLIYQSKNLAHMRHYVTLLEQLLNEEIELHLSYCQEWGISQADIEDLALAPATKNYTSYLLELGLQNDILTLYTALTPCLVGYVFIAHQWIADPQTNLDNNPYASWLKLYANDENKTSAKQAIRHLDQLAQASPLNQETQAKLIQYFRQSLICEAAFWQMGLDANA